MQKYFLKNHHAAIYQTNTILKLIRSSIKLVKQYRMVHRSDAYSNETLYGFYKPFNIVCVSIAHYSNGVFDLASQCHSEPSDSSKLLLCSTETDGLEGHMGSIG